jgi:hypothetical protein
MPGYDPWVTGTRLWPMRRPPHGVRPTAGSRVPRRPIRPARRRRHRRRGKPADICLGGIDGPYRADGGLTGVQNGLGLKRVFRVFLTRAGDAVERAAVLENRNPSFELPATGAVAGRSFYYMANTQTSRSWTT